MVSKKVLERVLRKFPYLFTESEVRLIHSPKELGEQCIRLSIRLRESLLRLTSGVFLAKLNQAGLVEEKALGVIDAALGNLTLQRLAETQRVILSEQSFPFHEVFSLEFKRRDLIQLLLERYIEDLEAMHELYRKQDKPVSGRTVDQAPAASNSYLDFIVTYFKSDLRLTQPSAGEPEPGQTSRGSQKVILTGKDRKRRLVLDPLIRRTEDSGLEAFVGIGLGGVEYVPLVGGEPRWCVDAATIGAFQELFLRVGAYRQAVTLGEAWDADSSTNKAVRYATHCYAGLEHMRKAKFHTAIVEFDEAHKIRSDIPLLHYHLGNAHEKLNNTKKAQAIFENLVGTCPQLDLALETLGDLFKKKGADEEARKLYEQTVERNPSNVRAMEKVKTLERWKTRAKAEPAAAPEPRKQPEGAQDAVGTEDLLIELTEQAAQGRLARAIGRDKELEAIIEILCCQNRNSPLILGEPGVGKTAVVEELANRIVSGKVPEQLRGFKIYLMSIATLLAGAKFRGQFEERILGIIKELKQQRCILFIDDMHTMVGSGVTRGGTLDTASLLKPALIRSEIQAIGATSYEEYRLNIEKDTSLMRSFQIVNLDEPDWETVRLILEDNIVRFSEFHDVSFDDFDRIEIARLIKVCIKDRLLPDIAINIFDRAATKVSLRTPDSEEDFSSCHTVRRMDVIEVLAEMSGVPVSKLSRSQTERFSRMEEILAERVIGQDDAISAAAKVVRTTKLNLDLNPKRPDGVFLFVGPSGVGKTELARSLSEFLFGDEEKMIRIDMSEYMEKISSSRLIGASPGYVGYNDQNQLTDMVRKNPYSLVLLDEIEKADDQMINLFLQVFDAGRLTDGKGRTVMFNNVTIVMTSNVGTHLFSKTPVGYSKSQAVNHARVTRAELMREIKRYFSPEFLNRIDEIVFFNPLEYDDIKRIALLKLQDLTDRLKTQGIDLVVSDCVFEAVSREGYSPEFGARNLARVIRRRLLDPLAQQTLALRWQDIKSIHIESVEPEFDFRVEMRSPLGETDSLEINALQAQLSEDAKPE